MARVPGPLGRAVGSWTRLLGRGTVVPAMFVNHAAEEINLRIVFVGADYAGKGTTLRYLHGSCPAEGRGELVSAQTRTEQTLFFDMVPQGLGEIRGYRIRLHLYCLTGEVGYDASVRLILQGVDGLGFVVDSQRPRADANRAHRALVEAALREQGRDPDAVPTVFLLNKRSLATAAPVDWLRADLGMGERLAVEIEAATGADVWQGLKALVRLLLEALRDGQLVEKRFGPEERQAALDWAARSRLVVHLGDHLGEPASEYTPRTLPEDRPYAVVLEHAPIEGRPYWTYCTAGLSLRPQPAAGTDPHMELLAYSPVGDRRVADVLMALAWLIATESPDSAPYQAGDTVDLTGLGLCHAAFVLAPAPEPDVLTAFPDVEQRDRDLVFLLAASSAEDRALRVSFTHVVPVTSHEFELAQSEGTTALLASFEHQGRQRFEGWPPELAGQKP